MDDMDPHMLFDFRRQSSLDYLRYWPSKVDVIEIYQFEVCGSFSIGYYTIRH